MHLTSDLLEKIANTAESALQKIGAEKIEKKVKLAVRFARSQPPEEIILDGKLVTAIAVTIATVFSAEGHYYQFEDEQNVIRTAETIPALSIVVIGGDVLLCKSSFDVIPGSGSEGDKFFNFRHWTTSLEMLTENYIC